MSEADITRYFRTFNAGSPTFIELSRVTVGPRAQGAHHDAPARSHARRAGPGPGGGRGRHARAGTRRRPSRTSGCEIYEPPRFFEAFLRGRRHTEPPDITARICGICPVAYQMSACRAIEDACGVTVPEPIENLRRLLYCGEWIESHVLHIYLLHAPDFLGYPSAIDLARDRPDLVERGLALKKAGNEHPRTARRPGHPSGQRPGRRLLPRTDAGRAGAAGGHAAAGAGPGPGDRRMGGGVRVPRLRPRPRDDGPGPARPVRDRGGHADDHAAV